MAYLPIHNDTELYLQYSRYLGILYLALGSLCGGLGNSLESVSILAFIQSFFVLLGFYCSIYHPICYFQALSVDDAANVNYTIITKRMAYSMCITIILMSGGIALGLSGAFGEPITTLSTVVTTYALGLLIWLLVCILSLIPQYFYSIKLPRHPFTVFIFPSSYSLVFHTIIGRTLSTFPAIANAVLDYQPLRQTASLFGIIFIEFLVAYISSLAFHILIYYPKSISVLPVPKLNSNSLHFKSVSKLLSCSLFSTIVVLVISGFIFVSNRFYQKPVNTIVTPYTSMSCVFAQNALNGSATWSEVWYLTETRLAAGDSLVLWSEESFEVHSDEEENELLSQASSLALKYETGYIGISYEKIFDSTTNHFALIQPDGTVAWNYRKSHPVPLVESDVTPGPSDLPIVESTSILNNLRLAGSICFDLDYPSYIQQASFKQVDLFLQPSWTWNALDTRHFEGDSVRAVENGFTLFRCSSEGESGVVSNHGVFLSRRYSLDSPFDGAMTFQVPLEKRYQTFYGVAGFLFEYFNIVFYCIAILQMIIIEFCVVPNKLFEYGCCGGCMDWIRSRIINFSEYIVFYYGPSNGAAESLNQSIRLGSLNDEDPSAYQRS